MVKNRTIATNRTKAFVAVLTATTMIATGVALAASQPEPTTTATKQSAVDKDFGKLSQDGAKAYIDLAQARLAIFDGRTADAKKYADAAAAAFDKAKADHSVFMKAADELKPPTGAMKAANEKASNEMTPNAGVKTGESADGKTPIAWLPVDGDVVLNEDFKAHPEKMSAVKEANQSLAKGDQTAAMEKLKLANVDLTYVVAVLPLRTTLQNTQTAAQDIDSGKYYEGSQLLRQVQDTAHYDVVDVDLVPKSAAKATAETAAKPAAATKSN